MTAFVSRSSAAAEPKTTHLADLDAFGSEEPKRGDGGRAGAVQPRDARRVWMIVGAAAAVVALAAAAVRFGPALLSGGAASTPGRVTIGTTPVGIAVTIDGQPRGLTPVSLQLDPGPHTVTLQRGADERTISLHVASGAEVTQHYEFAPQPPPPAQTATLSVTSDPAGARVLVDGETRGTSPVTVADLAPGRHRVTVIGENGTVERQVTLEAGLASSVVFSLPRAPAVSAGWLSVTSPFEVQAVERGDVIGTSASPRFMMPAGSHEVEFINETLGFRERRKVDITQGATAAVKIDARASVAANARPWAEVLIDGRSVGQTPIANLSLTLGPHQIVFRHPELGERRETLVVTARGPNRVAVDLTR